MGLDRYGSARVRFTWKRRSVSNSSTRTSQKVLADCKDQRTLGGKCSFFGVCTALEAHQRLKTDQPCPNLSWSDLEDKVIAFTDVDERLGRMGRCFTILKHTGVCYEGSKDTLKVKDFERINTKSQHAIKQAIRKYMKKGPMVGTFRVFGGGFDLYGQSSSVDEIYFANRKSSVNVWTHVVAVTGFGVQGLYPFWEFQNSYGPLWRGAARGFGQIYAVHLRWLYGFTLA